MDNRNQPDLLPYEKLAILGFNRKEADSLPPEVKEKLVSGEVTPLLKVSISAHNGQVISLPLKLRVVTDEEGNPALMAYPVRMQLQQNRHANLLLTEQEVQLLRQGDVVPKSIEKEGNQLLHFLQMDPETKSLLMTPAQELLQETKLKELEKVLDIELGSQQKQQMREGKPIELTVGEEKVAVGVDLKEPLGFKVIQGDLKEWERQKLMRYDEAYPEFMGFVRTDKNRWEYKQLVEQQGWMKDLKQGEEKKKKGISL